MLLSGGSQKACSFSITSLSYQFYPRGAHKKCAMLEHAVPSPSKFYTTGTIRWPQTLSGGSQKTMPSSSSFLPLCDAPDRSRKVCVLRCNCLLSFSKFYQRYADGFLLLQIILSGGLQTPWFRPPPQLTHRKLTCVSLSKLILISGSSQNMCYVGPAPPGGGGGCEWVGVQRKIGLIPVNYQM